MDSCKSEIAPKSQPDSPPIRSNRKLRSLDSRLHVGPVASIPGKLLHCVVIGKNIAVNTAQQGNRNFKYRNEKVIRGVTDLSITHTRLQSTISRRSTPALNGKDQCEQPSPRKKCAWLHKTS